MHSQLIAPTAALVLESGEVLRGVGFGAPGMALGEVCFNTAMTGYQETLTDPSYAEQIITFTFPHIGNVGANPGDLESQIPAARGLVVRELPDDAANWRATGSFDGWLKNQGLVGIAGVDTRALTRRIASLGAPKGAVVYRPEGLGDLADAVAAVQAWPGLEGMELTRQVARTQSEHWAAGTWQPHTGYAAHDDATAAGAPHVVALDFGAKDNILRSLVRAGCRVTVVPGDTPADEILARAPDGIFLSNGPGDPAATAAFSTPTLQALINRGLPMFGICIGQQLLALALGAKTTKMHRGHRGYNHPVKDLLTGKVEITSQNHGFVVEEESLPAGVTVTHRSLFDGTLEGFQCGDRPIFSVQYHPEASPGPHDSAYLFDRFVGMIQAHRKTDQPTGSAD